jgi:hypothetical protein
MAAIGCETPHTATPRSFSPSSFLTKVIKKLLNPWPISPSRPTARYAAALGSSRGALYCCTSNRRDSAGDLPRCISWRPWNRDSHSPRQHQPSGRIGVSREEILACSLMTMWPLTKAVTSGASRAQLLPWDDQGEMI